MSFKLSAKLIYNASVSKGCFHMIIDKVLLKIPIHSLLAFLRPKIKVNF